MPFVEDKEKLFAICDAALQFFRENANPSERFRSTIERVGKEKLDEAVWKAYNGETK